MEVLKYVTYTRFANRTEINWVFCIHVCGSHQASSKTGDELWKPGVLSKLRVIMSCSSDPQHLTLLSTIKEPKTWISVQARLYFQGWSQPWSASKNWTQRKEEPQPPSSACSSGPWPRAAATHRAEPRLHLQHQPAPPHSPAPTAGGNPGCRWPLTHGPGDKKPIGIRRRA